MIAQKKTETVTRRPKQLRSKARMNDILNATKILLADNNTNCLKMADIAQVAGVTVSSIYQYFPNKGAIVKDLAQGYLDEWSEQVAEKVRQVSSVHDITEMSLSLLNDFYHRYESDPVLQEIWIGSANDKSFENMDLEHTKVIHELLYNAVCHFYSEESRPTLKNSILLSLHLGGSAIRLALTQDKEQGDRIMEIFIQQTLKGMTGLLQTK